MNRIIKFRAWDDLQKEWEYSDAMPDMGFWKWVSYNSDTIFNQYTGLRDKNKNEIYEGDICKQVFNGADTATTIGEVKIESTRGVVVGNMPIWPHDVEIIGNIYENSELLPTNQSKGDEI